MSTAAVHLYPHDTPWNVIQSSSAFTYRCSKVVHFLRHAEGHHNVKQDYRSLAHMDARLTEKGREQCRLFSESIVLERAHLLDTELVVTSPLSRCLETTLLSLDPVLQHKPLVPIIALDHVRETVNYNCDRRSPVAELSLEHPRVDFSHVEGCDHDPVWQHYDDRLGADYDQHRESAELHVVADRARRFFRVPRAQDRAEPGRRARCW